MTDTTPLASINHYLTTIIDVGASDLHLSSECFPLARLHGGLVRLDDGLLSAEDVAEYARGLLDEDDWNNLPQKKNLDFAYETAIHGHSHRFRCNVYIQGLGLSIVMRMIPTVIPTWQECGLPPSVVQMTRHHQGLVLVTGPAGCGKTTTLAALIRHINEHRRVHIITIEDPIEYVHECKRALIHQRQVGMDVDSFQTALRGALREDPDVVLIGELRDLETTQLAITAAETGHLVLSTMHTNSAAKTIDRLIDAFPVDQQDQIRLMVSESLKAIIAQQLIPRADGEGRVLAAEILHVIPSIANMIRDSRTFQVTGVLQTHHSLGMRCMDETLADLFLTGVIDENECRGRMIDQSVLDTQIKPVRG